MSLIHWRTNVPVQKGTSNYGTLSNLQEEINDIFNDFFSGNRVGHFLTKNQSSVPAIDVIENEKNFLVKAELPGVDQKDIELVSSDGYLTIKAEKKNEHEENKDGYLKKESSYGLYQRSIALPESADLEDVKATLKNGVLNIEVAKRAESQKTAKKIDIKAA